MSTATNNTPMITYITMLPEEEGCASLSSAEDEEDAALEEAETEVLSDT